MRFAYADPPYPGLARKYYACEEVDHAELVARLVADFPDGWALSTSSEALRDVLALCPAGVRVAAWVRGARPGKSYRPRSAWEPVIVAGGRSRQEGVSEYSCDVLVWGGRQHSHPDALVGMKPAPFCEWMFRLLGACSGDALVDLFPGSGAVARAWELYVAPAGGDDGSRRPRGDGSLGADGDGSRLARAGRLPSRLAGAERRLAEAVAPRGEP